MYVPGPKDDVPTVLRASTVGVVIALFLGLFAQRLRRPPSLRPFLNRQVSLLLGVLLCLRLLYLLHLFRLLVRHLCLL